MGATIAPVLISIFLGILVIFALIAFACGIAMLTVHLIFKKYDQPKHILIFSLIFIISGVLFFASLSIFGLKSIEVMTKVVELIIWG